jgi:hypothetical protein
MTEFDEDPKVQIFDGYISPDEIIALVPIFAARYDAVKGIYARGLVDHSKLDDFQEFCADFFAAWAAKSAVIQEKLGREKLLEILELFAVGRGIAWIQDDYDYFEQLPEQFRIYRGASGPLDRAMGGLSWTTEVDVAMSYAKQAQGGLLLQAEIERENILLVFPSEFEIVPRLDCLIDPKLAV